MSTCMLCTHLDITTNVALHPKQDLVSQSDSAQGREPLLPLYQISNVNIGHWSSLVCQRQIVNELSYTRTCGVTPRRNARIYRGTPDSRVTRVIESKDLLLVGLSP